MKEKNIAVEILRKLMAEQIRVFNRTNVVKSKKFSDLIAGIMNAYYNGIISNMVKRLLKKYKYPPDQCEDAIDTVISQCEMWTDNAS